ncbi:MAG: helix-turn-helix domain-containing protein [Gammaproteobacteria bacterium]
MSDSPAATDDQSAMRADERRLVEAIGAQIREFRKQLDVTMAEVAHRAGLSVGMLSKIERGVSSPSLSTLTTIAAALNVPVTAFFRRYEEQRDCAYVRAGEGLVIERAGTRAGHEYRLLGHSIRSHITVEPYLVTLTDESEVFPLFQHAGVEFIYLLAGEVLYRHGRKTYHLKPGDSLFFDSEAAHGPEELISLPVRMIAVLSRAREHD